VTPSLFRHCADWYGKLSRCSFTRSSNDACDRSSTARDLILPASFRQILQRKHHHLPRQIVATK